MATDNVQMRNKLRLAGLVAGLCVWTAVSGVGSLSGPAGFFLAALTYWMLTGTLIWAVCKGDTGGDEQPPVNESEGLPGWLLLVVVLALLVWIGLSGVGDMSGSAGFVFALLAMIGLTGLVIWVRSGDDAEEGGDHRFAMLPEDEDEAEDAAAPQAASAAGADSVDSTAAATIAALAEPSAEAAVLAQFEAARADAEAGSEAAPVGVVAPVPPAGVADAGPESMAAPATAAASVGGAQAQTTTGRGAVPDDLKRIKGIGPALEKTLNAAGVTRLAQIAAWDEAAIDAMAARLGRMGGRIRHDDWTGQARALLAGAPAGEG